MNKLEQPCAETEAAVSGWRETVDRIVPDMEPVDEAEYPAEWALFMDRARIRRELLALSPPPSSHDGLRIGEGSSVAESGGTTPVPASKSDRLHSTGKGGA